MINRERVERYVRGYFVRHKEAWPTVRQVARGLRMRQADVELCVADHNNLELRFWADLNALLGDYYVEVMDWDRAP